ncbi:alanine racemase [Fusobacterium necrophorum]|uniref:alanine racemase n=1 Tax=Fusobacterium necrophorum TaxID=859 RepID=UPI002551583E|nr:alanine racemase [Fusobacterium necrophorum]MDK4502548.1 alanine racemase [Fusobacterium necrophorum]
MIKNSFYLEVNRDAILHNIEVLRKWKKKDIIPVIKANAYGHGAVEMAKTCLQAGITQVAVARYEEARHILEDSYFQRLSETVPFQILVFETMGDDSVIKAFPRIDMAINSLEDLKEALEHGISPKRMHVKIDLSFGRNGIEEKDFKYLIREIQEKNIFLKGIFSHLFASSYEDGLLCIELFSTLLSQIGREHFERIHLQNSASAYNYDCDMVTDIRVGMLNYGLQEPGYFHEDLQQAFSLKGRVDSIRAGKDMKYLAYERKEELGVEEAKWIAKIKIGYADGFGKQNENTNCLIHRKEYRIVEITMDNSFLEVDERVKVGDEVILFYNAAKVKQETGKQVYEHLTGLTERLPRKWIGEMK